MSYEEQKRCCTVCDAKRKCHVCGDATQWACSDCAICFGATVYVCGKRECREEHDRAAISHVTANGQMGGSAGLRPTQRQKKAKHPLKQAMDEIVMRLRFGWLFDEIFRADT